MYKTYCLDFKLSENKSLETQISIWEEDSAWFDFQFKWTKRCDHAGLSINIDIWRLYFNFNIYDHRHWDYENNCYCNYNTEDSNDN